MECCGSTSSGLGCSARGIVGRKKHAGADDDTRMDPVFVGVYSKMTDLFLKTTTLRASLGLDPVMPIDVGR